MNIAILVPTLTVGGAERAAAFIGSYYYDQGHQVYYFLLGNCGHPAFPVKGKIVRTHVFAFLSENSNAANIRELLLAAREMKKCKKKYHIDIAISFMEMCNFLNVCSKIREKVFVSVRTVLSERTECSGFLYDKRWIKMIYQRADKIIAVSRYVKRDLAENYKISNGKIVAIPNVSVRHEAVHGDEISWQYGEKAIICVGRLDPVKQQERIIRAFSLVHKKRPCARLILIGEGRQKNYLESVCAGMGLDESVIFAGVSTDVGFFFQHAKLFVLASRVEGFPNVIVEAMAHGVPIVTTDSPGGCGEIVGKKKESSEIQYCEYGVMTPHIEGKAPEQTGLVREEELLGMAMLRFLEDEELCVQYAAKAKKRAKDFSEEKIMALWNHSILGTMEDWP